MGGRGRGKGRGRRRRKKKKKDDTRHKTQDTRHKTQDPTKRLSIPHSAQLNTRKIKHRLPSPPNPSLLPPYPLNTTTQANRHRHFLHNNNPQSTPLISSMPFPSCPFPSRPLSIQSLCKLPTIPHPIPKLETTTVRVSYSCDFNDRRDLKIGSSAKVCKIWGWGGG